MGWRVQDRVAVPPSLPLGIERAVSVRSGSSGSATHTATRRRACWAARRTLPLGIERAGQRTVHCHSVVSVLGGTFRGEWQCVRYVRGRVAVRLTLPLGGERAGQRTVHCHSASSVPYRYDQGRVAVRPVRSGASGSASGTFRGEWQCWPGRTPDPQPSRRLESGPTGQMRSGNRPPSRRDGLRRGPQASAWGLTARKGAVWAEGLADGASWARPGHYKVASCGLRRCRKLRLRVRLVCSHGMSRMGAETYANRSNQPQS